MVYCSLIPCICTDRIDESRDFYIRYFNATVIFDCGWYVNLRFGTDEGAPDLALMAPQQPSDKPFNEAGLTYNFEVEDVDSEYARLTEAGLTTIMPIGDHPWGDRGFALKDPNGVVLYIYTPIEPSEEFKQYYR